MVENYSENVVKEVSKIYLKKIGEIEDLEYGNMLQGFQLKAAAVHLNRLGHNYSSFQTERGERIALKEGINIDEGQTLTLDGLRDLAEE